jgi:hypothetical protein
MMVICSPAAVEIYADQTGGVKIVPISILMFILEPGGDLKIIVIFIYNMF